jgi:acetylornithine deacetylase/succinyl-diaminopimelate desuccinylase-like protein
MRLVPGMTPAKAFALYKSYVEKIAPAGVDVDVRLIHSGDPCLIPVDNPYIQAATRALHEVWGKDTVFIRSGGSIPIVGDFDRHLGHSQRHDGLRPARRQSSRPQREIQPEELRAGH